MRHDNAPTRYELEPAGSRVDPAGRVGFTRTFTRNYALGNGNPRGGGTYSTVAEGRWNRGELRRGNQLGLTLPDALPMFDRTDPNTYTGRAANL